MAYADFLYYSATYEGTMPEADFKRLARQASAYIDMVTFDRLRNSEQPESIMDKVKDACCAVADAYFLVEHGGGVAAETNDGVSVTYALGISNSKNENQRLADAVGLYLGNTGLLYRGVG